MKLFILTLFSLIIPCLSYYSGLKPFQYINDVLDLSHYNNVTSFAVIKETGIKGIIHKATEGVSCPDVEYPNRKIKALKEGFLWGAYHFGTGDNGVEQANQFLKVVGNDPNIILALDVEEHPTACGGQMTLKEAEDFVTTVYNARSRYPLIYGNDLLLSMVKGKDTILRKCPLWIAMYRNTDPDLGVGTWSTWDLWQYTDGRLPMRYFQRGIANMACDKDTINNLNYGSAEIFWKKVGY